MTKETINYTSKIDEVLKKYNFDLDDVQVKAAVTKLIAEKVPENDTLDVKKFLFGSIELTTLKTTDSDESVMAFTERVNQFDAQYPDLPHVATICVYPCFARTVSETLEVEGVELACVSGSFPSSQALIEVKVAETALAVKDGATEIDIVMPVGKFLAGDYDTVCEEISELKNVCGENVAMKVILETGDLVYQKSVGFIDVCRCRLHQNIDGKRENFGHARGGLRDVSGHQGILRRNGHSDWLQACRRHQHRHRCAHVLHHREGSARRQVADQQVVTSWNFAFGQPPAQRNRGTGSEVLLITCSA